MEKIIKKKYYCISCDIFFYKFRSIREQKSVICESCKSAMYVIRSDHGIVNYLKKNGKRNK